MVRVSPRRPSSLSVLLSAVLATASATAAADGMAGTGLPAPSTLIVDAGLPKARADAMILAARRYDGFWSTGEEALARQALAPDFIDRTLPAGRPQGVPGPLAASRGFRAAIPDIRCNIEQMLVAGDRVVVHLHFTGHFTGRMGETQGRGQPVDFVATDIYRIADGRIAENWHIEDNLSLLRQMGMVAP